MPLIIPSKKDSSLQLASTIDLLEQALKKFQELKETVNPAHPVDQKKTETTSSATMFCCFHPPKQEKPSEKQQIDNLKKKLATIISEVWKILHAKTKELSTLEDNKDSAGNIESFLNYCSRLNKSAKKGQLKAVSTSGLFTSDPLKETLRKIKNDISKIIIDDLNELGKNNTYTKKDNAAYELLISYANLHYSDDGMTPLQKTIEIGENGKEIFQLLLKSSRYNTTPFSTEAPLYVVMTQAIFGENGKEDYYFKQLLECSNILKYKPEFLDIMFKYFSSREDIKDRFKELAGILCTRILEQKQTRENAEKINKTKANATKTAEIKYRVKSLLNEKVLGALATKYGFDFSTKATPAQTPRFPSLQSSSKTTSSSVLDAKNPPSLKARFSSETGSTQPSSSSQTQLPQLHKGPTVPLSRYASSNNSRSPIPDALISPADVPQHILSTSYSSGPSL